MAKMTDFRCRDQVARKRLVPSSLFLFGDGECRTEGADAATASGAAHWLQNPTAHDDSSEPGRYDRWMRLLLSCGRAR